MRPAARLVRLCAAAMLTLPLCACLEVDQHPPYANGGYAGQQDNRPSQIAFKNDQAAWNSALAARVQSQNEYRRAKP